MIRFFIALLLLLLPLVAYGEPEDSGATKSTNVNVIANIVALYIVYLIRYTRIGYLIHYRRRKRHPLVVRISASPANLLTLTAGNLALAKHLLHAISHLSSVLGEIGVTEKDLNAALIFQHLSPEERCAWLTARWQATQEPLPVSEHSSALGMFRVTLSDNFCINLPHLVLCLPAKTEKTTTLISHLRQSQTLGDETILILHPDEQAQRKMHILANDFGNLWVAPLPEEVTNLLLNPDPLLILARLISAQISLGRISPYQTGQGVKKDLMFFGRAKLLAHIMNRELSNYLVIGSRQMGKTTLLKALERRYKDRPGIECHFIGNCPENPLSELARKLNLPEGTDGDRLSSHIMALSDKRYIFMLDEADKFVTAERDRDYSILGLFRGLSEQGRAYFILSGFWQLYNETQNYQSPIYNFGETLQISALEPEACHELATRPMERLGISYADDSAVDRLLKACGGRANLISIACNEMLKNLDLTSRSLDLFAVNSALDNEKLEGWQKIVSDNDKERMLAKIVVYLTIRNSDGFSLAELLEQLSHHKVDASSDAVECLLDRLNLAYVITRQGARYSYAVPLFREKILAKEPERLLKNEVSKYREKI